MRLDKLKIGSNKASPTHHFKNLKDVTIDFDEEHWVTVLIGWNGTGKSNVLEALAIIFRDLITKNRKPAFAFQLAYRMGTGDSTRYIHIDGDPDRAKEPFLIHIATQAQLRKAKRGQKESQSSIPLGSKIRLSEFLSGDAFHLPRFVFTYYSGQSMRMYEVFRSYTETYDRKLRRGEEDPGLKRLFYAMPVHSQFVLLAFLIQESELVRKFLEEHLGLDPYEGVESVLFVLRQPPWKSQEGDPRFWKAHGLVQRFLSKLYDISVAPLTISRKVPTSLWNTETLEFKYLYVKDIDSLKRLVSGQSPAEFFRDLESTYVSQMIEEVRIRVRLRKNNDAVTFRELSEGEQQLLTVLGLLRFTAENESLFLLDEPDTHLNPRWSVDYITYLKSFILSGSEQADSSHILLATHNPLAIAELEREQVQILRMTALDKRRKILACFPELPPRGMGYAAIVTSDMFGIASSLDQPTQLLLEEQRTFAAMDKLSAKDQNRLDEINTTLDRLGFRFFHPDDEYSRYLRLRNELLTQQFEYENPKDLAEQVVQMPRGEREALAKRLISELIAEEGAHKVGDR